ncbi:MAG: hypothetical protein ACRDRN_04580 [Sciscionella sp.]
MPQTPGDAVGPREFGTRVSDGSRIPALVVGELCSSKKQQNALTSAIKE